MGRQIGERAREGRDFGSNVGRSIDLRTILIQDLRDRRH